MEPNVERYKITRIAFSVGAVVALGLRFSTGTTTWPLIVLGASLVIGLVIDLVIRRA